MTVEQSNVRPTPYRVEKLEGTNKARVVLVDPDSVVESTDADENPVYTYNYYAEYREWRAELAQTVADNFAGWLANFKAADYSQAAANVRAARNALLASSDKAFCLDRMGLDIPSGTTFTAWLSFFRGLGTFLSGGWATYRQALRDITANAHFPYLNAGDWPQPPEDNNND